MRVLVLGGTGFIGGATVRRLIEQGHDVTTFHRGGESRVAARDGGAESRVAATIRGDRRELISHHDTFARLAPDAVLDTIAYTEDDGHALVEALRGLAARLVVLSSQDVYAAYGRLWRSESGPATEGGASEDSPLRTSRYPYRAISKPGEMAYDYDKILVESAVRSGSEVPVTILRLPMVYGAGGDPRGRVQRYSSLMRGGAAEIRMDRAKARWRCTRGAVEDVAAAIALAVIDDRAAGRVYNVGEADPLGEAEWVRAIGKAAGWNGAVIEVDRQELPEAEREPYDFAQDLVVDTSRIRRELGFRESVGRAEPLRRAVGVE